MPEFAAKVGLGKVIVYGPPPGVNSINPLASAIVNVVVVVSTLALLRIPPVTPKFPTIDALPVTVAFPEIVAFPDAVKFVNDPVAAVT
jgi:hypothetical protein